MQPHEPGGGSGVHPAGGRLIGLDREIVLVAEDHGAMLGS